MDELPSTSVLTPAWPSRRAVTVPPNPEPITTACRRSSATGTLRMLALAGLATPTAVAPAAAPRRVRLDSPAMLIDLRSSRPDT